MHQQLGKQQHHAVDRHDNSDFKDVLGQCRLSARAGKPADAGRKRSVCRTDPAPASPHQRFETQLKTPAKRNGSAGVLP